MDLGHTVRNLPALKTRREKVPEHRRKSQFKNTVIGLLSVALGVYLLIEKPQVSPYLGYVLIAYGGFSISSDMVKSFGTAVPQFIFAFVRAFRGEKPVADEDSGEQERPDA